MKYLIEIDVSPQAGNELERNKGGPGPVVNRLFETFKPEHAWLATSERKIVMIMNIDNDADMGAMMIAASTIAHAYPKFTSVVPAKEFGAVVERAIQKANTATTK